MSRKQSPIVMTMAVITWGAPAMLTGCGSAVSSNPAPDTGDLVSSNPAFDSAEPEEPRTADVNVDGQGTLQEGTYSGTERWLVTDERTQVLLCAVTMTNTSVEPTSTDDTEGAEGPACAEPAGESCAFVVTVEQTNVAVSDGTQEGCQMIGVSIEAWEGRRFELGFVSSYDGGEASAMAMYNEEDGWGWFAEATYDSTTGALQYDGYRGWLEYEP